MNVLVLIVMLLASVTADPSLYWQPEANDVFDIRLDAPQGEVDSRVDLIELDVHDTDTAQIADLREQGVQAVCYFSVGTWEDWRPDAVAFPKELIGNPWPEWPGERYLDLRQIDALAPLFSARLDVCVEKGFVAVDPDSIDSWGADTGFPLTQADTERFLAWLVDAAHDRGLAIRQKNAPELLGTWHEAFDFAVTEDCVDDGWCAQTQPYLDAGKPVFAVEYTNRLTSPEFDAACKSHAQPFLTPVLKHRDLDEWSRFCPS